MQLSFQKLLPLSAARSSAARTPGSSWATDEAALLRLWREKRGEAEPEDLSGNLIVQLGSRPKPLIGIGTSATPARSSQRSSGG